MWFSSISTYTYRSSTQYCTRKNNFVHLFCCLFTCFPCAGGFFPLQVLLTLLCIVAIGYREHSCTLLWLPFFVHCSEANFSLHMLRVEGSVVPFLVCSLFSCTMPTFWLQNLVIFGSSQQSSRFSFVISCLFFCFVSANAHSPHRCLSKHKNSFLVVLFF